MSGKKGLGQAKELKSEEIDVRTQLMGDDEQKKSREPASPYIADRNKVRNYYHTVCTTKDTIKQLRYICLATGKRLNTVINSLLDDYIAEHQKELKQGMKIEEERNQSE